MNVTTLRLQVSARNVANSLSNASAYEQAVQVDASPSTAAPVEPASPALVPAYTHKGPNEDGRAFATNPYSVLSNEMVQQLVARFDLIADAHVIRADAMMQATALYQHP